MRKVAGRLRLDLAQFREVRGVLRLQIPTWTPPRSSKPPAWWSCSSRSTPLPVEEEVVSVSAGTNGKLDEVPVEDVRRFERDFLDYLRHDKRGHPRDHRRDPRSGR